LTRAKSGRISFLVVLSAISFPEHARSQVKGGHSSGEIELLTLNFQREFYACSAMLQNINKVFRISRPKFDTFYTEIDLKTTKNSGGNMYESFGLIGIQLPEKYKENFDVSSESPSICTVSVCIHRT
jgi:hypothetical protein